jgi:predicted peptidase
MFVKALRAALSLLRRINLLDHEGINRLLFSIVLVFLMIISLSGLGDILGSASPSPEGNNRSRYHYLLYLPKEYKNEQEKKWPLMIYLHGRSRRGDDLEKLKRYGPPAMIKRGKEFPLIVASPQCPINESWNNDKWFVPLLNELKSKYRIDSNRIYLVGMSLGGSGVWYTATKFPEYIAAIIPICGAGNPRLVCKMKHIPVWAFHGDNDRIVPPEKSKKMVEALTRCGGKARLTLLKNKGHDLHRVFHNEKIYEWLLKYKKK